MSQHVTCPKCKHKFEIDDLSERCEKYIAKITGGSLASKNAISIDVIGGNGETYQVKYAKEKKDKGNWHFEFSVNHIEPDFVVLFGIIKQDRFIFLLTYTDIKRHARYRKSGGRHGDESLRISPGVCLSSWIWDYRVSPENFMARVNELKVSQQIAMSFTKGLGDE